MAKKDLDLENERKYLISLIENANKDPGNAAWAQQQAQTYAEQYPGFSLDKPYGQPTTQPSITTQPTTATSTTPGIQGGGKIVTNKEGTWYESGGQWYRVNQGDLPSGVGGTLVTDQQGNLYYRYGNYDYLVGGPGSQNRPQAQGSYLSPYSDKIDALLAKLNALPPFDPNAIYSSPEYLSLKQKAEQMGAKAQENTLGAAAALTGGIPSSYAVAASKENADAYNTALLDAIPGLTQAAFNRYLQEAGLTMDQIQMLSGLDSSKYSQFATDRDYARSVLESDRGFQRSVFESDRAFDQAKKEFDYRVERDKLLDQRWLDQFDYQKRQDALNYGLQSRQISIAERNAALARDKFNWDKDPTNPANMKDPEGMGLLYHYMMNGLDPATGNPLLDPSGQPITPDEWIKRYAKGLTDDQLKVLLGYLPKDQGGTIILPDGTRIIR